MDQRYWDGSTHGTIEEAEGCCIRGRLGGGKITIISGDCLNTNGGRRPPSKYNNRDVATSEAITHSESAPNASRMRLRSIAPRYVDIIQ